MRLCVNVDYLLLLHDFFIDGLPVEKLPAEKLEKAKKSSTVESPALTTPVEQVNQRMLCEIRIENPQFILFENQFELKKTNSLIIDVTIHFNKSLGFNN